jgi:DNA polymerase-3 subunit epsilon
MTAGKWAGWNRLGFDLETTGVNTQDDRIVTAALVAIWNEDRNQHTTGFVVDPGVDIPEGAADVHGYTRERAAAEATHETPVMLEEITNRMAAALAAGIPVVGANVAFDLTVLEAEARRHGVRPLTERAHLTPVVDVMVLDKKADPYRKGGRKLTDLTRHYGIQLDDAHDAGADALAACLLWPAIMTRHHRKFPGMTLPALHTAQVGWKREQMNGLRAYFDRAGKEHDGCCGEWPIHVDCTRQEARP